MNFSKYVVTLAFLNQAFAAQSSVNLETQFWTSRGILDQKSYQLALFKAEIKEKFRIHDIHLAIEAEPLCLKGNYLSAPEWELFVSSLFKGKTKTRLSHSLKQSSQSELLLNLTRVEINVGVREGTLTLGRIRSSLGQSGIFISPMDRIDDFPTWFNQKKRNGKEALSLYYPLTSKLSTKSAYILTKTPDENRFYAKFQLWLQEGLELEAMTARLLGASYAQGLGFQKSIQEGELRFEAVFNKTEEETQSISLVNGAPVITYSSQTKKYLRTLTRYQKAYASNFILNLEYFYNGFGTRNSELYNVARLLEGMDTNLAKDYAGLGVQKTLNPLFAIRLQTLVNLNDQSYAEIAEIAWTSPAARCLVLLKTTLNTGSQNSEYSRIPDQQQILLTFYF